VTPGRARTWLLVVALLFSTGGVAIKWTTATSWQVASFRSAVAMLTLAVLLRPDWRRTNLKVLAVSCAYAATMVLFVLANKLTTSANAIFLQATAPIYLTLLAPWLLKERLRKRDLRLLVVLVAGLVLVVFAGDVGSAIAPNPSLGNLLGALAGITWAFTILGLRSLGSDEADSAGLCVVLGNGVAALFCLPGALPDVSLTAADGGAILFLGSIQIGLAYFLLTRAVAWVPALESSLLLLVEPALNPVWTWWILGESVAPLALVGGLVILIGTAIHLAGGQGAPSGGSAQTS